MGCVLSCSCPRGRNSPRKLEIGNPTCPSTTVDINMMNLQPVQSENANAPQPSLIMPMRHTLDVDLVAAATRCAQENRSRTDVHKNSSNEESKELENNTAADMDMTASTSDSVTAVGNGTCTVNSDTSSDFTSDIGSIREVTDKLKRDPDDEMQAFPAFDMSNDVPEPSRSSHTPGKYY